MKTAFGPRWGWLNLLIVRYDPRPSPNTTTGLPNGTVVPAFTGGDIFTPLLQSLGKYDLLGFINARWKSYQYPDWDLWQHEFSKHAVCHVWLVGRGLHAS
jgi:ribonuclease T2